MKLHLLLAACILALSGCASNIMQSPDGTMVARHKIGTNTGVELTATGDAANIAAASMGSVPGAPGGWNEDGVFQPVQPRQGFVSSQGTSTFHLIVGENQTKGLGLIVTAYISQVLSGAFEAIELGKQGVDKAGIAAVTKRAKIAANKDVALAGIEAETAIATMPAPVPVVPVVP